MSEHHNHDHACCEVPAADSHYRGVLWAALVINALMFVVEVIAGVRAESVSLLADAVDFLGDAANYGVSLFVLPLALVWRARAALVKGLSMGTYGVGILALTAWNFARGVVPDPVSMGVIGTLALIANVAVAVMLYRYRKGDANMRSVWLCTRNDAIGNVAVLLAALGVFGTKAGWPDLFVATIMAILALTAAISVVRQARQELRGEPAAAD
ncbi:cation transporter [Usitatibacter palustris]|nr:cation transporter [Usitatibacter palustris]